MKNCPALETPPSASSGMRQTHARAVMDAANQLSYALAGERSAQTPKVVSTWHP